MYLWCQIQALKMSCRSLLISKMHSLGRLYSAPSLRTRWFKSLVGNVRVRRKVTGAELDKTLNSLIKKCKLLHRKRQWKKDYLLWFFFFFFWCSAWSSLILSSAITWNQLTMTRCFGRLSINLNNNSLIQFKIGNVLMKSK